MDIFLKIYLPPFFLGFIVLVFVLPSLAVYRKTGVNPFRFVSNQDNAHDFLGMAMKGFIALLFAVILIHSVFDRIYLYLAPFTYLEQDTVKVVGLVLGHASLIGIKIAQAQMRLSWRIGIDYEHKTALVTDGIFRYSRNPIYLFLLLGLAGLFLIMPNAVTFAVLFAAYLILQVTMRLEEEFLSQQHGINYAAYKNKVRRLI